MEGISVYLTKSKPSKGVFNAINSMVTINLMYSEDTKAENEVSREVMQKTKSQSW